MATTINAIPFDIAAKEIGKELNQPVENIIKQKAIFSAKTI